MPSASRIQSVSRRALLDRTPRRGEPADAAFRAFVDRLVRLSARMQALRGRLAAGIALSPPQYAIAMVLAYEKRGLRVVDIAARLELSVTFVTTQLGRMEKAGLLLRAGNPADRRSSILRLSPAALARLARGAAHRRAVNDRLFASLSRAEMLRLSRVFARIAADADVALGAAAAGAPARRRRA